MTRLRLGVHDGFGHRWLRGLCVLVLAVFLVLVVVHCTHDAMHMDEGDALVCVALTVMAAILPIMPRLPQLRPVVVVEARLPVHQAACVPKPSARGSPVAVTPLRM